MTFTHSFEFEQIIIIIIKVHIYTYTFKHTHTYIHSKRITLAHVIEEKKNMAYQVFGGRHELLK